MKKVISIRFHTDSKEDMQLYEKLEREAGNSSSLAYVAKSRMEKAYEHEDEYNQNQALQDRIVEAVREEMQQAGMKIIDSLVSVIKGFSGTVALSTINGGNELPEESEELPKGALDFLE